MNEAHEGERHSCATLSFLLPTHRKYHARGQAIGAKPTLLPPPPPSGNSPLALKKIAKSPIYSYNFEVNLAGVRDTIIASCLGGFPYSVFSFFLYYSIVITAFFQSFETSASR